MAAPFKSNGAASTESDPPPRILTMTFTKITTAGAGTMGSQVAWQIAFHGKRVTVYDAIPAGLEKGKTFHRESRNTSSRSAAPPGSRLTTPLLASSTPPTWHRQCAMRI